MRGGIGSELIDFSQNLRGKLLLIGFAKDTDKCPQFLHFGRCILEQFQFGELKSLNLGKQRVIAVERTLYLQSSIDQIP